MLTENTRIYRDTYDLAELLLEYSNHVNKLVRYGIFADCINKTCEAVDLIYRANILTEERATALTEYLMLIGGVKTRIRLLSESGYLTTKQHSRLMLIVGKLLKQASAWRGSTHKPESESDSKQSERASLS